MEFTQGVRFDSLGLTEEVQRALKKKNIEESTPVQAGCIPPMREWKDVIAKAPTGTGKTFAFGIPIIEAIQSGLPVVAFPSSSTSSPAARRPRLSS